MTTPCQTASQRNLLERVRAEFKNRGIRLKQAPEIAGCSAGNLSRIFNGKIGLSAAIEERLASSFLVDENTIDLVVERVRGLKDAELKLTLQFLQIMQQLRKIGTST